jgi:hypothetical protein
MQIDLTPNPLREGGRISLPLSLKEERNGSENCTSGLPRTAISFFQKSSRSPIAILF